LVVAVVVEKACPKSWITRTQSIQGPTRDHVTSGDMSALSRAVSQGAVWLALGLASQGKPEE